MLTLRSVQHGNSNILGNVISPPFSGVESNHLTKDEKRAHLADLRREHLIDQVCV
jgi:hypothetical protein